MSPKDIITNNVRPRENNPFLFQPEDWEKNILTVDEWFDKTIKNMIKQFRMNNMKAFFAALNNIC
jgi:hypothetical protein